MILLIDSELSALKMGFFKVIFQGFCFWIATYLKTGSSQNYC